MDLEIIKLAIQGGAAVAMFIVFLVTFKKLSEQNKDSINTAKEAVALANSTSKEAFEKHTKLSETLIQILRDEQDYKTTLTGVLDRIGSKLETPAQCPLLLPGRKVRVEVVE
ncbi:MAG: hypothetical protein FD156_1214 [Nitrospirae bacterium]|nr:MAG: hypothetical protein FD156_1214 [Nitrospirota bacterium]